MFGAVWAVCLWPLSRDRSVCARDAYQPTCQVSLYWFLVLSYSVFVHTFTVLTTITAQQAHPGNGKAALHFQTFFSPL